MIGNELRRLFAPDEPGVWVGTVRRKTRSGYLVLDVFGRYHEVGSVGFWRPGQSVTVSGGRIVAAGASMINVKTIEV